MSDVDVEVLLEVSLYDCRRLYTTVSKLYYIRHPDMLQKAAAARLGVLYSKPTDTVEPPSVNCSV